MSNYFIIELIYIFLTIYFVGIIDLDSSYYSIYYEGRLKKMKRKFLIFRKFHGETVIIYTPPYFLSRIF